jgi:hypothetical protein
MRGCPPCQAINVSEQHMMQVLQSPSDSEIELRTGRRHPMYVHTAVPMLHIMASHPRRLRLSHQPLTNNPLMTINRQI